MRKGIVIMDLRSLSDVGVGESFRYEGFLYTRTDEGVYSESENEIVQFETNVEVEVV